MDQKWCNAVISGDILSSLSSCNRVQHFMRSCKGRFILHSAAYFPQMFHSKPVRIFMANFQMRSILYLHQFRILTLFLILLLKLQYLDLSIPQCFSGLCLHRKHTVILRRVIFITSVVKTFDFILSVTSAFTAAVLFYWLFLE